MQRKPIDKKILIEKINNELLKSGAIGVIIAGQLAPNTPSGYKITVISDLGHDTTKALLHAALVEFK